MKRPVILCFVRTYLPGFKAGGALRHVANLVSHLSDAYYFKIVTRDRDNGDMSPYAHVTRDAWNEVGPAEVLYASSKTQSLRGMLELIRTTEHDMIYLNSAFAPRFTLAPLLLWKAGVIERVPLIVHPHGEFSLSAISLKRRKKRLFLNIARLLGIYKSVRWQASSGQERDDILREVPSASVSIVPHIVEVDGVKPRRTRRKPRGNISIVFFSRIVPIKNLSFAIDVIRGVRCPVTLVVVGPEEDARYAEQCKLECLTLPANVEVKFCGAIRHEAAPEMLVDHDLLLCPSLSENFGYVIMEAWSAGLPVLISDRTPWTDLARVRRGWEFGLDDIESFRKCIERVAAWDEQEWTEWSKECLAFASATAAARVGVQAMKSYFDHLS